MSSGNRILLPAGDGGGILGREALNSLRRPPCGEGNPRYIPGIYDQPTAEICVVFVPVFKR